MSEREAYRLADFRRNNRDFAPDRVPQRVIEQTAQGLDGYFSDSLPNPDPLKEYLRSYSRTFLKDANRFITGLTLPSTAQETLSADFASQATLLDQTPQKDRESFALSAIIFSWIPEHYRTETFSFESLLSKTISRPQSLSDVQRRISEMDITLQKIVGGAISPHAPVALNPSLLRTLAFFEVGATMRMNRETQEDIRTRKAKEDMRLWLSQTKQQTPPAEKEQFEKTFDWLQLPEDW